jgi:ribosome biogenesis GTPase
MINFQFEKLRRIGLTPAALAAFAAETGDAQEGCELMRVVEVHRDACAVHDGEHERRASARVPLVVGDWVLVANDPQSGSHVLRRLAPLTEIARRANDGRRQPLASNVDTALLVMGLDLDFNPRRAERYVALVRACGVAPVLVLTKADCGQHVEQRVYDIRRRLPATVPTVAVNGQSPHARVELAPWLAEGQTLVLLGASGAGKSTLTNTLTGGLVQSTGGVRKGDGRGMHTTTVRSLHRCVDGACIIDTPGLRTWRPDADADTLAATFDDIAVLAHGCRFRDCTHAGEPGCAVHEHVSEDRLANYRKLLRDAERVEQTPLQKIAQRNRWKSLGKAGAARSREKREFGG